MADTDCLITPEGIIYSYAQPYRLWAVYAGLLTVTWISAIIGMYALYRTDLSTSPMVSFMLGTAQDPTLASHLNTTLSSHAVRQLSGVDLRFDTNTERFRIHPKGSVA